MTDPDTANWRKLVAEAEAVLASAGISDADISARLIGQRATGSEPGEWAEVSDGAPHQRQLAHFDAMVGRRAEGEPLQYVLGHWGFRHLDLFVDNRVLIPRPETETVAGAAIAEANRMRSADPDRNPVVVDLGTGSGAIGLSMAFECNGVEVWLTDNSGDALAVARANLAGLGTRGSRVRLVEGSWFEALPPRLRGMVDVVVSNPPYVGGDDEVDPQIRWEPADALFAEPADGHLLHLVETAADWLTDDGVVVLEMAPDQTASLRAVAAERYQRVEVRSDLAGRPRAIVAAAPVR